MGIYPHVSGEEMKLKSSRPGITWLVHAASGFKRPTSSVSSMRLLPAEAGVGGGMIQVVAQREPAGTRMSTGHRRGVASSLRRLTYSLEKAGVKSGGEGPPWKRGSLTTTYCLTLQSQGRSQGLQGLSGSQAPASLLPINHRPLWLLPCMVHVSSLFPAPPTPSPKKELNRPPHLH